MTIYNIKCHSIRPNPISSHRYRNHRYQTYKHKSISRVVTTKANIAETAVDASYYIGKGIILFTMFYTGLNYFHYKKLREDIEKSNKDDNKRKDSDKK
jgi:hypothetical protein